MKINKFTVKRSIISISKYPESFVKIEFVDLKKINNYCIVWVWNPLPQVNKYTGSYLSALFTLDKQNSNQVSEDSCAEAVPSTPPSQGVVGVEVMWSNKNDGKAEWNKNFHKY